MKITVKIKEEYDDYTDVSWLGEFSDRWKPNAIKVQPYWSGYRHWETKYLWYLPANDFKKGREWFAKRGYCRHQAAMLPVSYAHHDKKRLMSFYKQDWWMEVMIVTAYVNGIELASTACGGIESDGSAEYKQEIRDELVSEVVSMAQKKLQELKSVLLDEEMEIEVENE